MACSRVWPPRSNPVSNSPLRAEITYNMVFRHNASKQSNDKTVIGHFYTGLVWKTSVNSCNVCTRGSSVHVWLPDPTYQNADVSFRGTGNHVRHEALVARCINDGEPLLLGRKVRSSTLTSGQMWWDWQASTRTSTVSPFARSSSLVSKAQDRYQLSRFFSFASRSYFSSVRLSTMPVKCLEGKDVSDMDVNADADGIYIPHLIMHSWKDSIYAQRVLVIYAKSSHHTRYNLTYIMWPPIVDFPASTWPINTTFRVSRGSSISGTAAVLPIVAIHIDWALKNTR